MLKSKATRMIALFISLAMVWLIAFEVGGIVNDTRKDSNEPRYWELECSLMENEMPLYDDLWLVTVSYLRYLDENGNFTGSDALKKQTVKMLRDRELMDMNGNLTIRCGDNLEYYAAFGDRVLQGSVKCDEELLSGDTPMTTRFINGNWNHSGSYFGEHNWFETDYGMSYYYYYGNGIALFDFDVTGLDSYTDELGATIYYKLDGSTPIPTEYLDSELAISDGDSSYRIKDGIKGTFVMEHPAPTEPATVKTPAKVTSPASDAAEIEVPAEEPAENNNDNKNIGYFLDERGRLWYNGEIVDYGPEGSEEVIDPFDFEDGLYYYDTENGGLYRVVEPVFNKTRGDDTPITIVIRPTAGIIAEYRDLIVENSAYEKEITGRMLDLIPLVIVGLAAMLFFLIMGGYSKKEGKFVMCSCDRIFAELPLAVIAVCVFAGCVFIFDTYALYDFRSGILQFYNKTVFRHILAAFYAVLAAIIAVCANSIIVRMKCRKLIRTSLIGIILTKLWSIAKRIARKLNRDRITREMVRNDKFTRSFIIRFAIFLLIEIIAAGMAFDSHEHEIWFMLTCIASALFIWRSIADLRAMRRLNEHISAMHDGDYSERTEPEKSPIYSPTVKLNSISSGIQTAVDKQVKSERMKIDLVTNVSHDLKTPLTSIISYIDLLQTEELTPEARDYVTIIAAKSDRLKAMVADLFDLAKATSRTDVAVEQIDAVILTRQVLADLEDKITQSGRDVRADIKADSAPIEADGKKMYRVFQNLIDNALKYSLNGTRVYITLTAGEGECRITVKNIASYEMTFSPEEIMERFTRGDESRSTEGNGLGLSIAKSFTEACGGTFSVAIDGDMFTAEVCFRTVAKTEPTADDNELRVES